jgi:hypothetical protein
MTRPRRRKWVVVLIPLAIAAGAILAVLARDASLAARDDRRMDALTLEARANLTPGLPLDQAIQWLESRGLPHSGVIDTAPSPGWKDLPGFCPCIVQAAIRHRHRSVLRPVTRDLTLVLELDKDHVVRGVRVEEVLTGP